MVAELVLVWPFSGEYQCSKGRSRVRLATTTAAAAAAAAVTASAGADVKVSTLFALKKYFFIDDYLLFDLCDGQGESVISFYLRLYLIYVMAKVSTR